jgi:hypothetical protein
LYSAAYDGLNSRFPATQDLCFAFLVNHLSQVDKDIAQVVKNGSRLLWREISDFEWINGEAWLPEETDLFSQVERSLLQVEWEEVSDFLLALENEREALPLAEYAARCLQYLATNPTAMTETMMHRFLLYDLSLLRAEAARIWLSQKRANDGEILNLLCGDRSPRVILETLRGVIDGWGDLKVERAHDLICRLKDAACSAPNAYALLYTLTRFDRKEEVADPPWELFGALMPTVLQYVDAEMRSLSVKLWSATRSAASKLSAESVVEILDVWTERLTVWQEQGHLDDHLMGAAQILLSATEQCPELRQRVSRRLLEWPDTPALMVFLTDYIDAWPKLTDGERTMIRERTIGNREDRTWLQAAVLSQNDVPAELQEWITGDRTVLKRPTPEIITKLDRRLLESCVHLYCGMPQPLWSIGIHHRGSNTWDPVIRKIGLHPDDPLFETALAETVRSQNGQHVAQIIRAAGIDHAERLFSLLVTAQVAPSRNLLTRDSAYESTYP